MTYASTLQLFFHPSAFSSSSSHAPNAPISLTYIALDRHQQPKDLTTTLRFFLQLLRASLHALPQSSTRIKDLLALISSGWQLATSVAESGRRLHLLHPTSTQILSDERLAVTTSILLEKVRTKVEVSFELAVAAGVGAGAEMSVGLETGVRVVYGEAYNEGKMGKVVREVVAGRGVEGW